MPTPTMQALVAQGGREFALERVPRPEPGPGQVRVAVSACGICGSDLHLRAAGLLARGAIPGHEIAGVVDALGEGVTDIAPGTPVAVEPFMSCGDCPECRQGWDPLCRKGQLLGVHRPGGLAEHVVVPAHRLFAAPAGLAPEQLALAEPLAVSIHGLSRGALRPGQRVLVLGAGSVGLLTLFAARALGASEVWISARHPHQAERARALGAARVLREVEASGAALAAVGAETPVDLVVETVGGSADTLNDAAQAVRPGGAVVVLGLFTGPVALQTLPLLLKEVSLVWSYCYHHPSEERADFAQAVALLVRERERAAALVSHTLPLGRAASAFDLAADKKAGALKVSVLPFAASP